MNQNMWFSMMCQVFLKWVELLTTMRITFSIENSSLNMSENTTSKITILILINCFKLKIFYSYYKSGHTIYKGIRWKQSCWNSGRITIYSNVHVNVMIVYGIIGLQTTYLMMVDDYDNITLATISQRTAISRSSRY